jgi:archaellum component FlaF (FlaF/FlaG flagellin family)
MSLTKEVTADKIEVVATEDGQVVQVRTATRIVEDGAVISQSYHRHVINSGDDWSSEPSNVRAICNAVFQEEG